MWMAEFVLCVVMEGCSPIIFDDQTDFAQKDDCELYTEQKSDLIVKTMNELGLVGKIYYDCKQKEDGIRI